jgi:hypothetical protein
MLVHLYVMFFHGLAEAFKENTNLVLRPFGAYAGRRRTQRILGLC